MIYIGADHRGYLLKEKIKKALAGMALPFEDKGGFEADKTDDYPAFAEAVAAAVQSDPDGRGILICGSGHGMDMTANKFKGIRAALGFNAAVAKQSREHENSNILVLPADWVGAEVAVEILSAWLDSKFDRAERNERRLSEIEKIEAKNFIS